MARSTGLHCHAGDTAASPHWSRGHMATLPAWHVMVWHVMVWQQAQASSECRRRLPARLDHGLLLCSAALMSSVHCTPLCSATGGHCMACALRGHMRAHACAPHSMSWACMGCTQIHAHTSTSAHRHAHVHPHTHPHSRMYTHMHICTRCMSCKIYMNGAQTSMCAHTHNGDRLFQLPRFLWSVIRNAFAFAKGPRPAVPAYSCCRPARLLCGVLCPQMFEMDAYVGVDVLGLTFMKGDKVRAAEGDRCRS